MFETYALYGAEGDPNTETVVIVRETAVEYAITTTTVYSGPCDFALETGTTYANPAGLVAAADAILMLDPAADGSLPDVRAGDVATVAGTAYTVTLADPQTFPPAHLELLLKRGDPEYRQPVN